eukprot:1140240-Pelagomonas_calceolata.AAC.3
MHTDAPGSAFQQPHPSACRAFSAKPARAWHAHFDVALSASFDSHERHVHVRVCVCARQLMACAIQQPAWNKPNMPCRTPLPQFAFIVCFIYMPTAQWNMQHMPDSMEELKKAQKLNTHDEAARQNKMENASHT